MNFLEAVLLENFPFALITNLTVQTPEAFVVTFPLFSVHEPDTDHAFVPVEFDDAIVDVA